MTGASHAVDISKVKGAQREMKEDRVAVEEPLEIQLSSPTAAGSAAKSISITMRTPGDDGELALGFLFTEGIIAGSADVRSVTAVGQPLPGNEQSNVIRVELQPHVALDFERLQRHFYTTSSCGVCGKASLDALRVSGQESLGHRKTKFPSAVIVALPDTLRTRPRMLSAPGGLPAAAAFSAAGDIFVLREDVGRHNAVDKVVGNLLQKNKLPGGELGLLVSGRASFELMQKALVAGMPLLAAVGAPSSLAVQLAREFDMSLIGFLRADNFNIYSGSHRID